MIYDHEWNEHPDDIGAPIDGTDFVKEILAAGWDRVWRVGDDDLPSITTYRRADDWLVDIDGDGYWFAIVRCANPGQVLRIIREASVLLEPWNIWQQKGAPMAAVDRKQFMQDGTAYWNHQPYLVTTGEDADRETRN